MLFASDGWLVAGGWVLLQPGGERGIYSTAKAGVNHYTRILAKQLQVPAQHLPCTALDFVNPTASPVRIVDRREPTGAMASPITESMSVLTPGC